MDKKVIKEDKFIYEDEGIEILQKTDGSLDINTYDSFHHYDETFYVPFEAVKKIAVSK